MKRHNIFRAALALLLPGVMMTSCKFEEDDYFSESAALRIDKTTAEIKAKLCAPTAEGEQGWLMQTFVAGNDSAKFEGFNLFAKFYENGKVLLASDHRYLRDGNANKYTESTSLYEMLQEEGPVLAFNSWNDVLTPLSDPVNPIHAPGLIIKDGVGLGGDNNFVVMGYSDDVINLVGERYRAKSRLLRCDRPWEQYIADAKATKAAISSATMPGHYYIINETDTLYLKNLRGGATVIGDRLEYPAKYTERALVFTPTGVSFEGGIDFVISDDKTKLVSGDSLQIVAMWDQYIVDRTSLWNIDDATYSDAMKTVAAQINTEIKKHNTAWSLARIGFGRSSGSGAVKGIVITLYTNAQKTKTNTIGMEIKSERTGFGKITLSVAENPATDKNMQTVAKKAKDMPTLVKNLADILAGTYDITPDNYFMPTGATFTALDGSKTIVLK